MKVLRAAVVLGISTPLVVLACGSDDNTKADRMGAGGDGGEAPGGGSAGKTNNGGSNSTAGKGGGGSTFVNEGGAGGADVVGEVGGAGGADVVGEVGGAGGEASPPEPVCGDADVAGGQVCFKEPAPLTLVEGVPADLAIGDWDGAGGLDVIVASELGVTYFKNEGTGPAATDTVIVGLTDATAVLGAGQLDSQTKLDLVFAPPNSGTSTIVFGDGAGQVGKTEVNSFSSEGTLYNYFVADIAGSGSSQDLVVTFNNSISLVQTTGTEGEGFVTGSPNSFFPGATLDGVMVKLGSSQWLVYSTAEGIHRRQMTYDAGSVTLGLTTLDTVAGGAPAQLDVGDFNEDGFGDVVATLTDKGAVSVLFGDGVGAGDFAKVGATDHFLSLTIGESSDAKTARDVKVGDFNGDSHADIAVSVEALNAVAIFSGDGEGGFSEPKLLPTGDASAPTRLAVGDLNDDGVDDLAVVGTVAASKKIIILLSDP